VFNKIVITNNHSVTIRRHVYAAGSHVNRGFWWPQTIDVDLSLNSNITPAVYRVSALTFRRSCQITNSIDVFKPARKSYTN